MKVRQLHVTHDGQAAAAVELAQQMPGFDIAFHTFGNDKLLLSPTLWLALEEQYGAEHLPGLLRAAGLVDLGPIDWTAVVREGMSLANLSEESRQLLSAGWNWLDEALASPPADWHLDMCRVRQAWQGLGAHPDRPQIAWQTLKVGHIDTGYTEHPAFGFPQPSWIDAAAARSFDGDTVSVGARDAMRGVAAGHGTASGSLVCGADTKDPFYGVAPRVPMVPVRVDDCYVLDQRASEFEAAVRYLVDEVKVPIINVSMGTFLKRTAPQAIRNAAAYCYERGVLMIAAAGNVPVPGWPAFPAALPQPIAVAGVTPNKLPWGLSSSGSWVDISAPGKQVRRASTRGQADAPQDQVFGYSTALGGTTFATAMVSGAAALWLLKHGNHIDQACPQPWQRVEMFRALLASTACKPPGWSPDNGFGAGILDVDALLNAPLPAAAALTPR